MSEHIDRAARPEPFGRSLAGWVRFPRYELRDGVIRPARGAQPEAYDPWEDYTAARGGWGGGGGSAPYEALLELLWSVRLRPARTGEAAHLDAASELLVLDWCEAHGLLGILSHETEVAYLTPRWVDTYRMPEFQALGLRFVPAQRSYAWGATGWQPTDEGSWTAMSPSLACSVKEEGALVSSRLWSETWGPPRVVARSVVEGVVTMQPLEVAWGPYFPDVPSRDKETYRYPEPLSDEFWATYGEPVDSFISTAALFHDTLQELGLEVREGEDAVSYLTRRSLANRAFFGLVAGVHPTFDVTWETYRRAWRSKSLLASYAMMAYLDLTEGKQVRSCDVCGKPFVTRAYQARYCSARCRQTATQRAYRDRKRRRPDVGSEMEGDSPDGTNLTRDANPRGKR